MAEENVNVVTNGEIIEDYYVEPDTEIYILKGVPLDNTYEHTIHWDSLEDNRKQQRNYFISKAKIALKKHSYQRVDREWLKVYVNVEHLYDCNYIMFRNTAFNPDKWWYGFITDVEYINDNASKIKYEIDVMQSWLPGMLGDYQVMPCFVERCHSVTDRLYENLVPENVVNNNEYVVDYEYDFDMNKLNVVVMASEKFDGKNFAPADGYTFFGTYSKVELSTWNISDLSSSDFSNLDVYLNAYINGGKENSIVAIMAYPEKFRPGYKMRSMEEEESGVATPDSHSTIYLIDIPEPKKDDILGGKGSSFVPRNMKLYSYPFCYMKVNNECGTSKIYKWELFNKDLRGKFAIVGSYALQPAIVSFPREYKNVKKNLDDAVLFTDFTVCPWGSDAYRAWWAQNTANIGATILGGAGSVAAIAVGAASGNPMLVATGAGGAISSVSKIAQSLYEAKHQSTEMHGDPKSSLVLPMIGAMKFAYTKESMRPEILKLYDDYFTKYGYAQKKIMYPPLKNRKRWTYVQTVGFEFTGTINDKDSKKIKSIFDNGITFWANPYDVGHYEYDNDPIY